MILKLFDKFLDKESKSRNAQLNSLLSAFFRGIAIFCNFLLVPITLNYLDVNNYGVWLTLTSITAWLSFMDIGLGNGLRNKLAESLATGEKVLAREYVTTTYGMFSAIMLCIFIVFAIVNPFLDWKGILKTELEYHQLLVLTYVLVFSFCLRLVLDLAGMIIVAMHKPYVKAMLDFFISFFTLIFIYILTQVHYKSFLMFGVLVTLMPVLVLAIYSYFLFRNKSPYNYLKPSYSHFKKIHIDVLLSLGVQFFIIQLATLIIFSTDNILITQLFSPAEVASFNIAYKYYSVMAMCFSIIILPYWSAFTTAYFQREFTWIRGAFRKLIVIWLLQILGVALMILVSQKIYTIWVGDTIHIPLLLNMSLGLFTIICNWNNIFVFFLNGVSKIRLQIYNAVFICIVNVPLSYFLVRQLNFGLASIVLANCLCLALSSFWAPIQCYKIINNQAHGIWDK